MPHGLASIDFVPSIIMTNPALVFWHNGPYNHGNASPASRREVRSPRIDYQAGSQYKTSFGPINHAIDMMFKTHMKLTLLTHVFATLFMVGLIWFVQVVHYPLFANVGQPQFKTYEELHQRLTTWVVGPAMLVELVTALALVKHAPTGSATLPWVGLALVVVIWVATATLSVPAHNALTAEYTTNAYQRLVSTNWIRTVAWSARGILVLAMTSGLMK